tara:strand:- start:21620 stop:22630 length:1011 start_codon:yes stop_codon:yes gene_type:complete
MKKLILPLLTLGLILGACESEKKLRLIENTGYAQGSTYQIKYLTAKNQNFAAEIESIFKEIDNSMSTYVPTSLISEVNKGNVWVEVDELFITVLNRSLEIAEETSGDFDPTVAPIVRLWGFGFDKVRGDVDSDMILEVKSKTGFSNVMIDRSKVKLPEEFSLDFNAIAQGFTVDYIAEYLEKHGINDYMVEVGGEVKTKGVNDKGNIWSIGVDKPQSEINTEDRFQFILELKDAGLATSGNYRKYWVDEETGIKYSHTIDPHSGTPARNRLLSASIISPEAMDADAYATVCMVQGLERCKKFLIEKPDLEGYLVYSNDSGDWEVYITEGFQNFIKE